METKYCTKCGTTKPVSEFYKCKKSKDGLRGSCKACHKAYYEANKEHIAAQQKAYYETNREDKLAYQKAYQEANKEAIATQQKAYREANKEAIATQQKAYREANKESIDKYQREYREVNREMLASKQRNYQSKNWDSRSAYMKRWARDNPDKIRANINKRRALKVNAPGDATDEQIQARFDYHGNRCIYCGDSDCDLQIEHMIPLSRGGSNWPSNLAPSCKSCNCKKHNKTYKEFVK